jgi:hypothetical protein
MYLLDANVLKEAKNRYYQFQVCPGFWDWIRRESSVGRVASIDAIRTEIEAGDENDPLRIWVRDDSPLNFVAPDASTLEAMRKVVRWVMAQDYEEKNLSAFLGKADPFLVAHAMAHDGVVVTQEAYVPANSRKVKIPNVCEAMEVEWMNCFQMLNREKARFILER